LRRLFSTFAHGWPGAGLLLLRLAVGIAVVVRGFPGLLSGPAIIDIVGMATGTLVLVGLWTPISGTLVAAVGLWSAIFQPGDPWAGILLGTIGAALAMIGPGTWSVDARLFGWRRIEIHDRKN
jgi:hypothetical protein